MNKYDNDLIQASGMWHAPLKRTTVVTIGDNHDVGDVVLRVDVITFVGIGWIGVTSIAVMNDLSMR